MGIQNHLFGQNTLEQRGDSVSIFFEFAKFDLKDESSIEKLKSIQLEDVDYLLIKGYTDTIGDEIYNLGLAKRRMDEIARIIRMKNPSGKIEFKNFNEKGRNLTNINDSLYRRVDIVKSSRKNVPSVELNTPIILKINFEASSDDFTEDSYASLTELLNIMVGDSTLKVQLNGHVCCAPDQSLSNKRAYKVKKYLIDNGVSSNRINGKGYSNSVPLVREVTELDQKKNRRVEAIFTK